MLIHIAGHVLAVEHRGLKLGQGRIAFANRLLQIGQILEDQAIGTDLRADLADIPSIGDQLVAGRHVDAIDVRETNFRGSRREIDLGGPRLACHVDDLARGGATHDGVVNQQHLLALELGGDGVELAAHRFLALLLARHDEGPADIAVLHETLTVGFVQALGDLQGDIAGGFRDRNDHIDIQIRPLALDLLTQLLPHVHPGGVDGNLVDEGVRTGKVDIFEDARTELGIIGALQTAQLPLLADVDRLPRRHIPHQLKPDDIECRALGGNHVLNAAVFVVPTTQHQRADAVRIAKCHHAMTDDERHHRIGTAHLTMHPADGGKDVIGAQRHIHRPFQFVCENV